MINLLTALQETFNSSTALTSVFPNGLENAEGADIESLPNIVVIEVGCSRDYSTTVGTAIGIVETATIQFTARSNTGDTVATALANLMSIFDHKYFQIPNNELLIDSRLSGMNKVIKEDERVYRGDIEFNFTISRSI